MSKPRRTAKPLSPGAAQLYLLFTPELCHEDPWWTLQQAVQGGVQLVQWRVKLAATAVPDQQDLARCRQVTRDAGVGLIVNDDVQLAVDAGADGAHVGHLDMPVDQARSLLGDGLWLGASTHSLAEAQQATRLGADHLGFGPMFPTATKGYDAGQPAGSLTGILQATPLPVFAIGGIDAANVGKIIAEGGRRVAVSSAILQAEDPAAVARRLREQLR